MINPDNSITTKIKISCQKEGTKTLLKDSYGDIPYKVVHYGSKLLHEHLEIMLMSYSPGIMDGDRLDIDIHCAQGTELKLFTQSFNKLHPMKNGAQQYTKVCIEEGALFQFLPHPAIPFRDSIFQVKNEININKNGHLIWGDIISGGRIHAGEQFQFTSFHSTTKIYQDNKIVFYDNQLIEPGKQPVTDLLFFEGRTHQGTLILVSPFALKFKEELDALLTEQFTDMSYGFTQCSNGILMIRALGVSGEAMHDWLGNIGSMCWSFIKYKMQEVAAKVQAELEYTEQRPERAITKKRSKPKPVLVERMEPLLSKKRL